MPSHTSQDEFQKTALRLPKDLHTKLHEAAALAGRSYNAEILARLQQSFEGDTVSPREVLAVLARQERDRAALESRVHGGAVEAGKVASHLLEAIELLRQHDVPPLFEPTLQAWAEAALATADRARRSDSLLNQAITNYVEAANREEALAGRQTGKKGGT